MCDSFPGGRVNAMLQPRTACLLLKDLVAQ